MEALELYTSKGALVQTQQGVEGAKSSSISIAKSKQIQTAFGIKQDAAQIKREEIGIALKTLSVMELGAHASNPAVQGARIKHQTKLNGDVTHTYTLVEHKARSASETAIAAYLGMTVEQVRAKRAEALKSSAAAPVDVQSTVSKPEESPVEAGA